MTCRNNIIFKNVLKDIRQFKIYIILILLGDLFFASFMALNTSDQSWRLYILNGSGLISAAVIFYLYFDWNYKNDILTCSLPITRKEILYSKYILSSLIVLFGSILFFISAYLFNTTADFYDYYLFSSPALWILILAYHIIFISLVHFARYQFESFLITVLTGTTTMVVFILFTEKIIIEEGRRIPNITILYYVVPITLIIIYFSNKLTLRNLLLKDLNN